MKKDKKIIDFEIKNIKNQMGEISLEKGQNREEMKNHLRKEFFRNKSKIFGIS